MAQLLPPRRRLTPMNISKQTRVHHEGHEEHEGQLEREDYSSLVELRGKSSETTRSNTSGTAPLRASASSSANACCAWSSGSPVRRRRTTDVSNPTFTGLALPRQAGWTLGRGLGRYCDGWRSRHGGLPAGRTCARRQTMRAPADSAQGPVCRTAKHPLPPANPETDTSRLRAQVAPPWHSSL